MMLMMMLLLMMMVVLMMMMMMMMMMMKASFDPDDALLPPLPLLCFKTCLFETGDPPIASPSPFYEKTALF